MYSVRGARTLLRSSLREPGLGSLSRTYAGVSGTALSLSRRSDRKGTCGHVHHAGCRCCSSSSSTKYGEMYSGNPLEEDSPFVSKHFELREGEIDDFFRRFNIDHRIHNNDYVVKVCPFCHDTKQSPTNMHKLSVNKVKGFYNCYRCNSRGTWWTLKNKIANSAGAKAHVAPVRVTDGQTGLSTGGAETQIIPKEEVDSMISKRDDSTALMDFLLNKRGLDKEVLDKYRVGGSRHFFYGGDGRVEKLCMTFPMTNDRGEVVRYKLRSLESKGDQMLLPKGGNWGLFGLDTVPADAKEVILTEGEFDAMAAYQGTGIPAISLPNGANSLPVDVLPFLERFDRIYLWMDDDISGRGGASTFTKKLGVSRCHIVKTRGGGDQGPKDANDALRDSSVNMKSLLESAKLPENNSIVSFRDMMSDVYEEFKNPKKVAGIPLDSMPSLNNLIKGHRRGEFTIVSGHTGVGKTTLMAQTSLDLCMKGVRTLWGSFELNNIRMAKILLGQYHYLKTKRYLRPQDFMSIDDFKDLCMEFESLPLFFMKFFGSCPTQTVLETMEYAHYVHDAKHIVLDNLQFMLSGQARGTKKFDLQDEAIIEFRKFATSNDAHISLVMHPRKENDDELLQTSSISGTAKATQEADNIILLQRSDRVPFIEVKKNRFDGATGRIPVIFDPESRIFTEKDGGMDKIMRFAPRDNDIRRRGSYGRSSDGPPGIVHPGRMVKLNEREASSAFDDVLAANRLGSRRSNDDETTVGSSAQRVKTPAFKPVKK